MSFITEIMISAGALLIGIVFSWKVRDILRNKEVNTALFKFKKSKGIVGITKAYIEVVDTIFDASIPGSKFFRIITISLNSSLIMSIAEIAEQIVESSLSEKKAKTIVGLMLGEKLKKSANAQLFLIATLIFSLALSSFLHSSINVLVIVIIAISLLAIQIDHKLIEYRVKNGWYGKNEFETREIIEFIISHADKDDFNDSGGLKKVIPMPELLENRKSLTEIDGVTI